MDADKMEFDMLLENLRNLAHDEEHESGADGVEVWILEAVSRLTAMSVTIARLEREIDAVRLARALADDNARLERHARDAAQAELAACREEREALRVDAQSWRNYRAAWLDAITCGSGFMQVQRIPPHKVVIDTARAAEQEPEHE